MGCIANIGQPLSAGSLCFGVLSAQGQKHYCPSSSCFIFYLITLILVSVDETGLGGKSPKALMCLKMFRFGLYYLELAIEIKPSVEVTLNSTRLRHCLNSKDLNLRLGLQITLY